MGGDTELLPEIKKKRKEERGKFPKTKEGNEKIKTARREENIHPFPERRKIQSGGIGRGKE